MAESKQILQMLQEGQITVDEADELLRAMGTDSDGEGTTSEATGAEAATEPSIPPNMRRFRRLCYIPFAISLVVMLLSGWVVYALYYGKGGAITLGFVLMVIVFSMALLATALSLWMTSVPWLHIRIQDKDGKRIPISLPLPLTLVNWMLQLAKRFVDDKTAPQLEIAAGMLVTMRGNMRPPFSEPIIVDVDDDDERVLVYIG